MEQGGENIRISWKNSELLKFFLEACIQEVNLAGRQGSSLKSESWVRIRRGIDTKFGIQVTQRQMKNHYDYLKDKYQQWVKLKNKTGNIWNAETNTFSLTVEEWDEYIKANPKAKTLKTQGLQFPDLCVTLFEGASASGILGWGPRVGGSRPDIAPLEIEDNIGIQWDASQPDNEEEFDTSPGVQSSQARTQSNFSQPNMQSTTSQPNLQSNASQRPSKRTKLAQSVLDKKMSNLIDCILTKNSGPSTDDCIKKLEGFGWSSRDPLYLAALVIFCENQSYRDVWMSMDDSDMERIQGWIMLVGKKLGIYNV